MTTTHSSIVRSATTALAGLALLTALATRAHAQDIGIKVGDAAPDAQVQSLDGTPTSLGRLYGTKPVVLEFWATWCPLCKKLEPAMEAAHRKWAGQVAFVGVGVSSNQSPERQKAYVEKQQLTGQFVFDVSGAAVKAFSAPHTSYVVVIGRDGKVVYTGVGAEQDVEAAIQRAQP